MVAWIVSGAKQPIATHIVGFPQICQKDAKLIGVTRRVCKYRRMIVEVLGLGPLPAPPQQLFFPTPPKCCPKRSGWGLFSHVQTSRVSKQLSVGGCWLGDVSLFQTNWLPLGTRMISLGRQDVRSLAQQWARLCAEALGFWTLPGQTWGKVPANLGGLLPYSWA